MVIFSCTAHFLLSLSCFIFLKTPTILTKLLSSVRGFKCITKKQISVLECFLSNIFKRHILKQLELNVLGFFFFKSTSFSGSEVIFPPWKTMVRKIDRFLFFLVGFSHRQSLRESQLFLPLCKKAIYYTVLYVLGKGGGGTLCTAEGAAAHLVM